MPLSFPAALTSFADVIRMASVRIKLADAQEISLGGSKVFVHDLAPKYWEFDVTIITMENAMARQVQAIVESFDGSMNDFYLYDPRAEFPISDPDGSILGAANVQINSLNGNNKELTLKGLPDGYVLSAGDMLSFDFGTPAKRALHRIVVGGAASGSVSPSLEVRPHIEPGAAVNAVVTLIKPSARVKMVPDSYDPGTARQTITSGMSFKCRQVM